jgi:transcriptional regulator with XRE-family HTH domain
MSRSEYQDLLGQRLRAVRTQQDLTLQQVEERSEGKWKAVVIGAYERGDRAISAAKLADLADFYGVPVAELLPDRSPEVPADIRADHPHVVLDLTKLEATEGNAVFEPVSRYAATIQRQRGDYNGRVLTVRGEDVRTLSAVLGMSADDFLDHLEAEGVIRERA